MPGKRSSLFDLRFTNLVFFRYRVAWHSLFWLGFLIYEVLVWGMVDGEYGRRLVSSLIELPVKVLATYFTLYILIDKLLIRKKYGAFLILLLASLVLFGFALRIVAYYTIYPLYWPEAASVPLFFLPKILISIFAICSLVAIVALFHLIKHWYKHQHATNLLQQTAQQLEKEKLEAELKLLKSQINPHFLFNTLNNLYVLTLNTSHKAPEMVYKLSQLMHYMLYDGNQQEVALEKEIQYIENYISLEKIRYDANVDVSLNVYNDIDGIYIAPLLILPFVENSFKHGLSNRISGGWVRIDILVSDSTLIVKIENSKTAQGVEKSVKPVSGIGLLNVGRRLDLIYSGRHTLQIIDEKETYLAVLKIKVEIKPANHEQTVKEHNPIAL